MRGFVHKCLCKRACHAHAAMELEERCVTSAWQVFLRLGRRPTPSFWLWGMRKSVISCLRHRLVRQEWQVSVESIAVPENLTLRPYTHWAVYAMSSLVEQSMPTSLKIYVTQLQYSRICNPPPPWTMTPVDLWLFATSISKKESAPMQLKRLCLRPRIWWRTCPTLHSKASRKFGL